MSQRDPYEVLGVSRDASGDEIRAAYRRLARKFHPDVNRTDPDAETKFKEIGQAYEILSDDEKRARFDRFGTVDGPSGPGGPDGGFMAADFSDLFDMFFGGGAAPGGRRRTMARDGDDLQADVSLTLGDVLNGVQREIQVNRPVRCDACNGSGGEGGAQPTSCDNCRGAGAVHQVRNTFIGQVRTSVTCPVCQGAGVQIKNPCSKCRGAGLKMETVAVQLNIPAGVEDGARMHLPGHGGEGVLGGRPGDLYVRLNVADDPRFERHGTTLFTVYEASFAQVSLGDEVEIAGIDGVLNLEIPPGTAPGTQLGIRNAGLPPLHGGRRGDVVVQIGVRVPTKLNEDQARLLRDFAEASGEAIPKGPKGGFLGGLFGKKK